MDGCLSRWILLGLLSDDKKVRDRLEFNIFDRYITCYLNTKINLKREVKIID